MEETNNDVMSNLLNQVISLGGEYGRVMLDRTTYGTENAKQLALQKEVLLWNTRNGSGTGDIYSLSQPRTLTEFLFGVPQKTASGFLPFLLLAAVLIAIYFLIKSF